MSKKAIIADQGQLLEELGISNYNQLANSEVAQNRLASLVPRMTPELLAFVTNTDAAVATALCKICEASVSVSRNLADVQKARWSAFGEAVRHRNLSAADIRDLASLITETERAETKEWASVMKRALEVAGGIAAGVLIGLIILARRLGRRA